MRLMCTGHRPNKLGGPGHPLREWVRARTREHLENLKDQVEVAVSGMALGMDMDFAQACVALGIPFLAAVPFPGQDFFWSDTNRALYQDLLGKASEVVHVRESLDIHPTIALHDRNAWMVDFIGEDGVVLAAFDGSKGGTAHCVSYARKKGRKILLIDPTRFYEAE